MATYTKTTNFTAKDNLTSGDPAKVIKGSEFDAEFNAIETAVNSKANANNTVLTGTTTVDAVDINTLQIDGTTVTATPAELNTLDGITSTTAELNTLDGFTGTVDDLNYAKDLRASGVTSAEFDKIDGLTADSAELNILDGATVTTAELNILDGVTATALEINTLDGITASTAELNVTDGLTATTAELNTLDGITATTAELNKLDGVTASTTELNYVDGVTSGIQSQLNAKASSIHTHVKTDITDFNEADYATAAQGALADSALQPSDSLDATDSITITSTDADAGLDPELNIYRNSGTPVNSDLLGAVKFTGRNNNAEDFEYGTIYTSIIDVADGSEDGKMHFGVGVSGAPQTVKMTVDSSGVDVSDLSIAGTAVTATATELNTLDGLTATTAELNYTDGVTSNIQTQLNGKATTAQGALADSAVQPDDDVSFGTGDFSGNVDVTGTVTADGLTVDGDIELRSTLGTDLNITSTELYVLDGDVYGNLNFISQDASLENDRKAVSKIQVLNRGGAGSFSAMDFYTSSNTGDVSTLRRMRIDYNGDVSFYEDTGTTAKMVWDASDEQLILGGGLAWANNTTGLQLGFNDPDGYVTTYYDNTTVTLGAGVSQKTQVKVHGQSSTEGSAVTVQTGGTERMRIDSAGNLRVGVGNTFEPVMQFTNSGRVEGNPGFTFSGDLDTGMFNPSTQGTIAFSNNGSESMRIDSSGNLLVGGTSAYAVNATTITSGGTVYSSVSGGHALEINRNTNDGDVVRFNKDGSTVGSIGVDSGSNATAMFIGSNDTGLEFAARRNDTIAPFNPSTNIYRDDAINLGGATERFKDLYLSGGVYLGGTGAANKLDDYEEGTWLPVVTGHTTAGTCTYSSFRNGYYTKIGNNVSFNMIVGWSDHTGTGAIRISLPFLANSATHSFGAFSISTVAGYSYNAGYYLTAGYSPNKSNIEIAQSPTGGGTPLGADIETSVSYFIVSGTYRTA